ncbi:expressed unknown protein [Seminavis robusta]|uniref:Uncharacterized protein n=1 Tax=Seminavis robusta TaxID=568900 RepID=A0A9N8DL80_9STRA|nr:expressed unknown protein [Seminavis robusta]|eukprot:Sro206_g086460.1 n/a (522) ;mRNA; r:16319-17884
MLAQWALTRLSDVMSSPDETGRTGSWIFRNAVHFSQVRSSIVIGDGLIRNATLVHVYASGYNERTFAMKLFDGGRGTKNNKPPIPARAPSFAMRWVGRGLIFVGCLQLTVLAYHHITLADLKTIQSSLSLDSTGMSSWSRAQQQQPVDSVASNNNAQQQEVDALKQAIEELKKPLQRTNAQVGEMKLRMDSVLLSSPGMVQALNNEVQTLKKTVETLQKNLQESRKSVAELTKKVDTVLYDAILAFLHIGKAGGTSFDTIGQKIADEKKWAYLGGRHFDWSQIEVVQKQRDNLPVHVVTLLRQPVERAVSHFYFWKTRQLGGSDTDNNLQQMSLSKYLLEGNKQHLLETRDIWQDGQAGVSWLTGTHIASWVAPKKRTEEDVLKREQAASNATAMLTLAAARLRETRWFGILEDLPRSMRLLQHEFNLSAMPSMPMKNMNNNKATLKGPEYKALASLMPQDLWLYQYARRLFEARWQKYATGVYQEPPAPPMPTELSCVSTRVELSCTSGPLAQYFPPAAG